MKTKLERTLLDRSKQVAVIIPLLVGGAFIVVEAPSAWAAPSGYEFKLVSSLGAPAPGGGTFINDFEPGGSIIRATWPSELNSAPGAKESSSDIAGKSRSWDARTGLRPAADSSTLWSQGKLSVIVRTGTVIPGIGTIDKLAPPQLVIPPPPISTTTSGAINNEAGQVIFQASLTDDRGVFLLATPRGHD